MIDDGIVLDMRPMKGARVDPVCRVVRAQAGLTWGELAERVEKPLTGLPRRIDRIGV
ncbi:FAD-binding protein [Hyalangium rubrum]|uniref:FAD-binding protein n=1 Tax=Hyalangium rubrum TaxID=3103134 RepID=UPI003BF5A90E